MSDSTMGPVGGTLEDFLTETGQRDEVYDHAAKEVFAWELAQRMRQDKLSKAGLARAMGTSRTQVDRILDPANMGVTLDTMAKAARVLGKRVRIVIEDVDDHRS